jgi:hypothetical protein
MASSRRQPRAVLSQALILPRTYPGSLLQQARQPSSAALSGHDVGERCPADTWGRIELGATTPPKQGGGSHALRPALAQQLQRMRRRITKLVTPPANRSSWIVFIHAGMAANFVATELYGSSDSSARRLEGQAPSECPVERSRLSRSVRL